MKTRVDYTKDAERDLDAIAEYTLAQWGAAQCAAYLEFLEDTCARIIPGNLQHARPVPQPPALLRWYCERHVIYLRRTASGIEIVRLLHERLLSEKHL